MKKILASLVVLLFISACDSPRSQRGLTANNAYNASGMNFNPGSVTSESTSTGTSGSTSTTTTNSSIPSDATHCTFSTDGSTGFASTSSHLGDYTLCQSSSDKNSMYFQLKTPPVNGNGDVSICFIPTTSYEGNSIYVGNPMCGYFKDPKSVRKITFVKYAQYSNATINGAIFFKDLSYYYYNSYMMTLEAYKTCMNMLASGNNTYCERFKSVGQYVYKQF